MHNLFGVRMPVGLPLHVAMAALCSLLLGTETINAQSFVGRVASDWASDVALDQNGGRLFVTNVNAHTVSVFDAVSGAPLAVIPTGTWGHPYPISAEYNPATNRLYIAHSHLSGSLLVVDAASYSLIHSISTAAPIRDVAIDPSTNQIYMTAGQPYETGLVLRMDGESHAITATTVVPSTPSGLRINTKTKRIFAVVGTDVSVINAETMAVIKHLPVRSTSWYYTASYPAINERTNRVYVADDVSGALTMIDGETLETLQTIPAWVGTRGLTAVDVNPQTNRVFVTMYYDPTPSVTVLDGSTLDQVAVVPMCCGNNRVTIDEQRAWAYVANLTGHAITILKDDGPPATETPVVSWTPAPLVYGQALSSLQLNAIATVNDATVEGSFVYSPAPGTLLDAGAHELTVTFTPSDLSRYESVTHAVTVTVDKAMPVVSVESRTITYDGAAHQAIASVTGVGNEDLGAPRVTYNGSLEAPVSAGTYTLLASFPGTTNYHPAAAEGILIIERAVPFVSWMPASPASLGTPLGDAQLNATANVAGVFTYTPAAGALLPVGAHTLHTTFSPADSTNYTAVTSTAALIVSYNVCLSYDPERVAKLGSTIPIRLTLCDSSGANVSASDIALTASHLMQVTTSVDGTPEDAGNANPDSNFRFDADSAAYIFNLSTSALTEGGWHLVFSATGDSTLHRAPFQVR